MTATLDAVADRLERIEALLAGGAATEPVRTLSVDAVVRCTGAPRRAVLAAIRSGDLPAIEIGERTRVVRPRDLDQWLSSRELRSAL